MKNIIVYDIEIARAIPVGQRIDRIEYCEGWDDVEGMGIASIAACHPDSGRYRVFMEDNFHEFEALVNEAEVIVGFNNIKFDDEVCRANGIRVPEGRSFDILAEVWSAAGFGREVNSETHIGYGLNAVARANGLPGKSGTGANAPILFQRQQYGSLLDYNLADVWLTAALLNLIRRDGILRNPVDMNKALIIPPVLNGKSF